MKELSDETKDRYADAVATAIVAIAKIGQLQFEMEDEVEFDPLGEDVAPVFVISFEKNGVTMTCDEDFDGNLLITAYEGERHMLTITARASK